MPLMLAPESPPLRVDETGTIRVGKTRIILEVVLQAYRDGVTAEQIVEDFDTLTLADVHGTISFYLRHKSEVDEYLSARAQEAAQLRNEIESDQRHLPDLRARVQAARQAKNAE